MKVFLSKYDWNNRGNIWVSGFIREGDKYLRNNDLVEYFSGIDTIINFEKKLKSANGQFSVVIKNGDSVWAASDRLRNYPLFWTSLNGEFLISDNCYLLAEKLPGEKLNSAAVDSFLATGLTVNALTLIEGIFQIEAGEYIIEGNPVARKFYYDSALLPLSKIDFLSASDELVKLFNTVFESHFRALSDKFIVIPLSGGYDSRLIAVMCRKYHPENVLCYTYGIRDNCEVAPAREVASRLGFKWVNIIYDSQLIDGYLSDDIFNGYYKYVSNLSSMFFMQEYFAVKYLKENSLVPENSVFMSGFCGDMLAGKYVFPGLNTKLSKGELAGVIYKEFFSLIVCNKISEMNLIKEISEKLNKYDHEAWRFFESWDQKERHAKFIQNSAKVYCYFGYDYVHPLWDNKLQDFFFSLPFKYRLNKKLYDYVLKEFIFKDPGLNFPDELNPKPLKKSVQRIKERIKRYIPDNIKNRLINLENQNFYDGITKYMLEDMGPGNMVKPRQSNYYNSYIVQWYLIKTQEQLLSRLKDIRNQT